MENEIDKEWLDATLAQCATELQEMLKSDQIAKSATSDAPVEESEGGESPAAPIEESDEDEGGEGAPDEASPEQSAAAAAPEGSPEHEGGEIEPAPSVEQLQSEYVQLGQQDPEALKQHYLACKSALMALMGADQGQDAGSPPPAASPAPAGPPASSPPPTGGAPMAMSERAPRKVEDLGKAERAELDSLRKQLEEQDKALLQLVEVVATPIRKSVKGLSDLRFIDRTGEKEEQPARGPLTKKEVQGRLCARIREGKLSKADKELVVRYNAGTVDLSKIEHLIADAK